MKDKIFYLACFSFAAGVLWRSLAHIDSKAVFCIGAAYFLSILFSFILKKDWSVYASVAVLSLLLGIARFQMADAQPPAFFESEVGKNISFSAMIVDEPVKNASQIKLIVETLGTSTETSNETTRVGTHVVSGVYDNVRTNAIVDNKDIGTDTTTSTQVPRTGIVIFSKTDQGFHYGDLLHITGKLEKPANFMTDQDMEFDYVDYLRKDGIFYTMENPQIEIVSRNHGNVIKRALFMWREKFDAAISKAIPAPESTVLGGVILGERYAFSPELRQIFMNTGTIHIVTIGGYHVTLVAQWIMKIFSFLPEYAGIGAGIISIFLYVIVTGGAQTSIRAGIMATLALFANATGRRYASGRALILAAVIMIAINPFVLVYDVSFELSFMATIAIIFLSPHLEPYFKWIPWQWLRGIVTITCSMYVFALPFVLYRIGNLSLVALPANILIVPLMPITMIAGFATGFAGLVSPFLAIIPGKIATSILYFQIAAVALLAHLPFAAVAVQNFSLPIIVVIYGIFMWIFFKGEKNHEDQSMEAGTSFEGAPQTIQQNRVRLLARGPSGFSAENTRTPRKIVPAGMRDIRLLLLLSPLIITFCAAGFLYYNHFISNQTSLNNIQKLLSDTTPVQLGSASSSVSSARNCKINGVYPDHSCTPGAIFADATKDDVCIKGYTASVRNVSTATKKQVFEEYGISYPQPTGAYEVDHFIPLALGGANDIANLFPEAAAPTPGFHEKDVVEVFLQEQVCSGRASLAAAQRQISTD